jgi:hypothetical protein
MKYYLRLLKYSLNEATRALRSQKLTLYSHLFNMRILETWWSIITYRKIIYYTASEQIFLKLLVDCILKNMRLFCFTAN